MIRNVLVVLSLATAVAFTPVAASAHAGHDHGKKAKTVKKTKAKQTAVEWRFAA